MAIYTVHLRIHIHLRTFNNLNLKLFFHLSIFAICIKIFKDKKLNKFQLTLKSSLHFKHISSSVIQKKRT